MIEKTELNRGWTLSCNVTGRRDLPAEIPAKVPGCVHLDLLAARLIPDPYLDINEITNDWIGKDDWTYRCTLDASPDAGKIHELVFDGLDTVATIVLNGEELGRTFNMHRTYRFDVSERLKQGSNELVVAFRSAYAYGAEMEAHYGYRPNNYPGPGNLMRKMACNFGWDWGPTLVTAGIWKLVRLESWERARLAETRVSATLAGRDGLVTVRARVERHAGEGAKIVASIAGISHVAEFAEGADEIEFRLTVPAPQIWWPHHLGAQPLYPLQIELRDSVSNDLLDSYSKEIGFRSVRLDTAPDEHGSAFTFVVNDVPLFLCGANWIPDDCFPSQVTAERYTSRIEEAKAGNINLLRVWGGGIFERDEFYEACDRAGMLVWQDFLFACASYPEEEPLRSEVEAEVRDNVMRLMPHPSLIVWNGNNENIWGFDEWGWRPIIKDGVSWGLGYYLDVLPKLCAELDPDRPYYPGSPYSGTMEIEPNADEHGCKHIWDVWNDLGYEVYRNYIPRFCSEFGWQAPPNWATIEESVHDTPLTPTSNGVFHHQKATQGNDKLIRGLAGHLPVPRTMDDWHFATQLNQARAIRFAIEHMRSHRAACKGAVVWQFNDCWPVTSWAALDSAGRRKPLWYAMQQAFDPRLLTIQPRSSGLAAVAVNERTLFWRAKISGKRLRLDGTVLAEFEFWRLLCDRFEAKEFPLPADIATPDNANDELIVVQMLDRRAFHYFVEDVDLKLPAPQASIEVSPSADGYEVKVTAVTFLKDLCLMSDRLDPDAVVDSMLVTLLPGQSHIFGLRTATALSASDITIGAVLRSANDLVATN
ncbi:MULTISPECIES: glycoside hydrolase family 2 protein [unclassified Rhizobium]|uniref:glycoside hydrolase family 2 protein n=1 Tax=unclassified Rhizobium TaxID=2613769 RepID=UPI001051CDE5|nr:MULTISPECIES: glycoside hydrolase family 2 protein [unclassified Rhizobium]MBB3398717.1 beta-mannosidase [Rhizobium sp. BK060]MBB4171395.1 beta-mannosidase [Rhizobium sp. BK538]TCM68898.1 beta-mannosidase [Rhizobium sp. BK068]